MPLIKGENISISINGEILACWRSMTLQVTADTVGISTVGSGNWKEFEGVALSWTVNGEGLIYHDEDFTIDGAFNLMMALEPVEVVFSVATTYYSGNAIITSAQQQGNVNDNASFNISLQGTGKLNTTESLRIIAVLVHALPSTEVEITFDYDPVPGATSYTIEITDITTSAVTTNTGGAAPRLISGLDQTHEYSFRLKSNPGGSYGSPITWP